MINHLMMAVFYEIMRHRPCRRRRGMIIVKTPTRVSFCGGGSDLPVFYRKHGAVLSAGLSRYIYISIHPYFHPDEMVCASIRAMGG